jgi:hypothetical protein
MIIKKEKDWYRIKRYPHIGLPLKTSDRFKWIEPYITNPENVAKHSFLPLIHKTSRVKKFRKKYHNESGKIIYSSSEHRTIHRFADEKVRELFYASHIDSLIFSYYTKILSEKYEAIIKKPEYNLNEVVNAYRSIPIDPRDKKSSNKCSIDFAHDVFTLIKNYSHSEFSVITFDITSYFDNINHEILRNLWAEIIDQNPLPQDHFNVYKNITRFSYVNIVEIFELFKNRIFVQGVDKKGKPLSIKRKKVARVKYLRNQNAVAFCTKEEFYRVKQKLIHSNKIKKSKDGSIVKRDFGIPQGSPISSVLSNIYLLHFDKFINNILSTHEGYYRRYSDDIIIICPVYFKENIINAVNDEIHKYKLEIQQSKTKVFRFIRRTGHLSCGQEFNEGINWNKVLIYLGFQFDGKNIMLKSACLSNYYRRMKRHIKKAKYYATIKGSKTNGEIFKNRLFKRFSYKGAKRIRKHIWDEKEKVFIKSDSYNWGNFLSYAYKASKIMIDNKIKNQTKRHWNILNSLIK